MAEQIAPQVEPAPESQFSMNWTMIDGFGANVQITMRATRLNDWAEVMKTRKAFAEKAQENGWTFPGVVKAAVGPTAAPPAPASTAPVAVGGASVKTIHATRMDVKPRTDGKLDIEFYEPGHNYPDIKKAAVDVPGALKLLAPTGEWLPTHFDGAKSYPVKIDVDWRDGKPNSKGQPYKDIVAVKAV